MSPECSKESSELCYIACGERTNIRFVLISVLQSNQRINLERTYPQAGSSFPGLMDTLK